MKLAVVFSGQGAQYSGMGKSLYDSCPSSKAIFDAVPEEIKNLCFNGTAEELNRTSVTQPCVYAMTMAAYGAFYEECKKIDVIPEMVAGFSLGECAALTAANVYSFADGFPIVTNRGNWMQEAAGGKGTMAAVIGKLEKIEECVKQAQAYGMILPVNYNSPMQTVVSGDFTAVEKFTEIAKENKLKVFPLKVGGPFHSPVLAPAAEKMKAALSELKLNAPAISLYANVTGQKITDEDLPDILSKQIMSPVRWEQSVRNMIADGADVFVEVGPGKTLRGLISKIDKNVTALNVEDVESLNLTIQELIKLKEA